MSDGERRRIEIAEATVTLDTQFACDRCGERSGVMASGHQERGFVTVEDRLGARLPPRDASARGRDAEIRDAEARGHGFARGAAEGNLALARCPKCSRRSIRASGRALLPVLIGGSIAFVFWVFAGRRFFIDTPAFQRVWFPDVLFALPLTILVCAVHLKIRYRQADQAVLFE